MIPLDVVLRGFDVVTPHNLFVMDFTLVKLNDVFMIGEAHTLRPSLKMTVPQPLPTMSKPLDITSSERQNIFWRNAKQTTIAKSKGTYEYISFFPQSSTIADQNGDVLSQ